MLERTKDFLLDNPDIVKFILLGALMLGLVIGAVWIASDPPVEVGNPDAPEVLILLHGYGANKDDLVSLAEHLHREAVDFRFIMPQAPHSTGRGYAWIPSYSEPSRELADAKLVELRAEARATVMDIVEEVISDGVQPKDIYVGGFSQGGAIALDVLLHERGAAQLGGLVFLSGGGLKPDLSMLRERATMRAFVSHGRRDSRVGIRGTLKLVTALKEAGHDVTFEEFEEGHRIPPETILSLRKFLVENE